MDDKELIDSVRSHLEFLGYSVTVDSSSWAVAKHDRRLNFLFGCEAQLLRFGCQVCLGQTEDTQWFHEALVAINVLNKESKLVRYALFQDDESDWVVLLQATLASSYSRESFGSLVDLWHIEQERINQLPPIPQNEELGSN